METRAATVTHQEKGGCKAALFLCKRCGKLRRGSGCRSARSAGSARRTWFTSRAWRTSSTSSAWRTGSTGSTGLTRSTLWGRRCCTPLPRMVHHMVMNMVMNMVIDVMVHASMASFGLRGDRLSAIGCSLRVSRGLLGASGCGLCGGGGLLRGISGSFGALRR